jgi:hypothetical protein
MSGDHDEVRERVRQNRVRRAAARQGIDLRKIRRMDPRAIDYGLWTLDDPRGGVHLAGVTLDVVEVYLTDRTVPEEEP